jgi:hypothetical protein
LDVTSLIAELRQQAETASSKDLKRQVATLAIQVHKLDTIFDEVARRANAAEYLSQFEPYLKLALKALSQCRATIETLAEIKNFKPAVFVQRANISSGSQQINNRSFETSTRKRAPARGKFCISAKQTIGATAWRTAGHWNGEPSSRQRSGDGDRGSNPQGQEHPTVRPRWQETLIGAVFARCCAPSLHRLKSSTERWNLFEGHCVV